MLQRAGILALALLAISGVLITDESLAESTKRGFLGFRFHALEGGRILEVVGLYPNGPAEAAGLQVGDVIQSVNGSSFRFETDDMVRRSFDWVEIGETVDLRLRRGETSLDVRVVAGAFPESIAQQQQSAWDRRESQRMVTELLQKARSNQVVVAILRSDSGELALDYLGKRLPSTVLPALNPTPVLQETIDRLAAGGEVRGLLELDQSAGRYQLAAFEQP